MKISNANFTYELPHQHVTDTALPPISNQNKGKVSSSYGKSFCPVLSVSPSLSVGAWQPDQLYIAP
jgi:hypothetical protein